MFPNMNPRENPTEFLLLSWYDGERIRLIQFLLRKLKVSPSQVGLNQSLSDSQQECQDLESQWAFFEGSRNTWGVLEMRLVITEPLPTPSLGLKASPCCYISPCTAVHIWLKESRSGSQGQAKIKMVLLSGMVDQFPDKENYLKIGHLKNVPENYNITKNFLAQGRQTPHLGPPFPWGPLSIPKGNLRS